MVMNHIRAYFSRDFSMWAKLLLKIYNLIWYLLLPGVILYLCWRSRKLPSYRQRMKERLGLSLKEDHVDIWMHAVSVGEVNAASSMVEACLEQGYKVLLTTMTPTGADQVKRLWGDRVVHQYCPYDFSFAIRRFLMAYRPQAFVIFETELWPGILSSCQRFAIPAILVNARISNRSYPSYLKTKWIWRYVFTLLKGIYVQSEGDRQRFLQLGVNPEIVHYSGNLKFKQRCSELQSNRWRDWKKNYPQQRVVVFGSTHPGEEALILKAWPQFMQKYPNTMAVFVPRHPERFAEVGDLLLQNRLSNQTVCQWSEWTSNVSNIDYFLVDAMGELSSLYAIADIAFVGGSLVPIGGHNVLEPMAFGVPVMTGPYMQNQQDLVKILCENQAMIVLDDVSELPNKLDQLLRDEEFRLAMIDSAHHTLKANQGATGICMQALKGLISQAP
jgi:3-deoxy-D-manno-octulosonic-acid transferase